MKGIRGFRGLRPHHRQDFKSKLLSEAVPDFDSAAWADDLHQINRGPKTRIQTRDRGWVEIDPREGIIRTWGKRGRAAALAEAIGESQGWHVESLRPTGDLHASGEQTAARRSPDDLATWWRERGYDAVPDQDGVWVDVGSSARIQDVGDQMRLHGPLTPEAARALVLKASEAWGGDAELSGPWSQQDKDALWLEAQRAGVRLGSCEPSAKARAVWEAETTEAARRADTVGLVKATTGPARLLLDAAAGDVSALAKLDPDLRAFVSRFLDDDQRSELAKADLADLIPEMARFRALGADERARAERDQKPPKVMVDPLDMAPPPASAPGL